MTHPPEEHEAEDVLLSDQQEDRPLLPEEKAAGSTDPEAQARAILEDSEQRTVHPEETRRESTQTPDDHRPGSARDPR